MPTTDTQRRTNGQIRALIQEKRGQLQVLTRALMQTVQRGAHEKDEEALKNLRKQIQG